MSLKIKTPPAIEPMTLQEAKDHLKVDLTDDDSSIEPLIAVARREAEKFMARSLITQTWELFLDAFPGKSADPLLMHRPPLLSVTSIKYVDADGAEQTWDAADYKVDTVSVPARIFPAFDKVYPTTRVEANAVTIEFITGYGTNAQDVPEDLIHAMKLIISDRYENRGSIVVGTISGSLPTTAETLLIPYRDLRF